jgi:AraC-like DNA-binding protein
MTAAPGSVLNKTAVERAYREWPDPAEWVRCWWEQRVGTVSKAQRVVPDGCSDIIVTAAGEATVVGPTMNVALHPLVPGTHLRGLRFRTEALSAALRLPGVEIRDEVVPLSAVLPDRAARQVTEAVWAGRFPEPLRPAPVDPRVRHAVRRLWRSEVEVPAVAGEIGVTERHLRRLLLDHTGIGPKSVQRVGRFQRFLRAAEVDSPLWTLAALAAEAGYADQAHLAREARALTGLPPSALLRERSSKGL